LKRTIRLAVKDAFGSSSWEQEKLKGIACLIKKRSEELSE